MNTVTRHCNCWKIFIIFCCSQDRKNFLRENTYNIINIWRFWRTNTSLYRLSGNTCCALQIVYVVLSIRYVIILLSSRERRRTRCTYLRTVRRTIRYASIINASMHPWQWVGCMWLWACVSVYFCLFWRFENMISTENAVGVYANNNIIILSCLSCVLSRRNTPNSNSTDYHS